MNEYEIPINAPIIAAFDENVDAQSLNLITLVVQPTIGGDAVTGKVTVQGHRVVFRPENPLKPNTTYEVKVALLTESAGAISQRLSGWQFTTASQAYDGPIIADTQVHTWNTFDGRWVILVAAVEQLRVPAKHGATQVQAAAAAPPQVRGGLVSVKAMHSDRGAAKAALAAKSAAALSNSGDLFNNGIVKVQDGVYACRLDLADEVEEGPHVAALALMTGDGKTTEPVLIPTYIGARRK
jgi:hypothetical protein